MLVKNIIKWCQCRASTGKESGSIVKLMQEYNQFESSLAVDYEGLDRAQQTNKANAHIKYLSEKLDDLEQEAANARAEMLIHKSMLTNKEK